MNEHKKSIIKPILIVAVAVAMIYLTGAWKLAKWLPLDFGKLESSVLMQKKGTDFLEEFVSSSILKLFSSSPYIADMAKFVREHPDNAEYQFGWSVFCMMERCGDPAYYCRKAEQLDPDNALYPYWLGLIYTRNQSGSYWKTEAMPDSALAAFERAGKIEPDNAAIDLAKLDVFVEEVDSTRQSYYYRRSEDISIRFKKLTEEGRAAIIAAMNKPEYRGHTAEGISAGFKLMKDSDNNNFYNKMHYYTTCPLQRFMLPIAGIKLFVDDIRPFENRDRVEAVADTLLRLSNIGLMMRDDLDRTMIQHMIGSVITTKCMDMLGDLYLLNDMPVEERLTGQFSAENKNSRVLRTHPINTGFWNTLITKVFPFIAVFIMLQPAAFITLAVAIVAIIILLIFGSDSQIKTRISSRIAVIVFGALLTIFFFFGAIATNFIFEPYLIIAGSAFIVGMAILIYRLARGCRAPKLSLFLPIMLIIIGGIGALCAFTRIYSLAYIGFLIAICAFAFKALRKSNAGFRSGVLYIASISAELFAFFGLLIVIIWFIVASPMSKFMNMTEYNLMVEFEGPGAELYPAEYNSIGHYLPIPGANNHLRDKRIERLEEMFDGVDLK